MRTMADMRREQDDAKKGKGKKGTEAYNGGERSGMGLLHPGENPSSDSGPPIDPTDPFSLARANGRVISGEVSSNAKTVIIYADGFVIESGGGSSSSSSEGEFRPLSDPYNKKFLDDIQSGHLPQEFQVQTENSENQGAEGGQPSVVDLKVIDKRPANYPGKGAGMTGGAQSSGGGGQKPINLGAVDMSQGAQSGPTMSAENTTTVPLDPSKPLTTVMIRFGDGRRATQEFNEDSLVQSLFDYISSRTGTTAFKVLEGFPPAPIVDGTKTIKEAGLCKGSVTVKSAE